MESGSTSQRSRIGGREAAAYMEHKIESVEELATLMEAMDQDEGIRVRGSVEDLDGGGFIFISKSNGRYVFNLCDRVYDPKTKDYMPGGNDRWLYFDRFEEAWKTLMTIIHNPLEAYSY
ncbi:hypothetical protein KEJ51_03270 [Candidatus Bathyarchaeota archaeon]|nr:hypothetical protein [Candidatus Bathyarchaeota archaeon]